MTPKQRVLRAYPGAESVRVEDYRGSRRMYCAPFWRILDVLVTTGHAITLGEGGTPQRAWADAERKLGEVVG